MMIAKQTGSVALFMLAMFITIGGGLSFASGSDSKLEGRYCITGFDPTFCREAPYNLPGVEYVGEATIVKHVNEGKISYTMTQHFPALIIPTSGGNCETPEQDFSAIGLKLNHQISFALISAGSEAPSINTYKIQGSKLIGKWVYQDDFRVGRETLRKVPMNFNCPVQP